MQSTVFILVQILFVNDRNHKMPAEAKVSARTMIADSPRLVVAPLFPSLSSSSSEVWGHVQGSTNMLAPGFMNFVLALAYHFWLNLPAAFTQPGAQLLVEPCTYDVLQCVGERVPKKQTRAQ